MIGFRRLGIGTLALGLAGTGIALAVPTVLAWGGPPVITALCAPNSTVYAWQVSFNESESNYNVDISPTSNFSWPYDEISSGTQPFDFTTPQSFGHQLYAVWDSDRGAGTAGPVAADGTACGSTGKATTTSTQVKDPSGDVNPSPAVSSGETVWDTATVRGGTWGRHQPTGTVTYSFFDNGTCSSPATATDSVTFSGDDVPSSSTETVTSAGSYSFDAVYSGDSTYAGSSSSCEPFSVSSPSKASTTTSTQVKDPSGDVNPSPAVSSGETVWDTATVHGGTWGHHQPTGTVTYSFFDNGTCSSSATATDSVTFSGDDVPSSTTETVTTAGSYSFDAVYSGDSTYAGSTSSCEPFSVASASKGSTTTTTQVKDAHGDVNPSPAVSSGDVVWDTATVRGETWHHQPTGTVTYSFFENGTCSGPASSTDPVSLRSGAVRSSSTETVTASGPYSFDAIYSGDSRYAGSTSSCEPFSVASGSSKGSTTTSTQVKDATGDVNPSPAVASGDVVWDTATVRGGTWGHHQPTGTVTYSFFDNAACSSPATSTGTVTLNGGSVPNSSTQTVTAAGSYAFDAVYSGSSYYTGSSSSCEPFSVGGSGTQGAQTTTTATQVMDSHGEVNPSPAVSTGDVVWDTATVSGPAAGIVPTGTVTYSFFENGTCSGPATSADTATLISGAVPISSTKTVAAVGSYSFDAVYSGDSNDTGSTSSCEPFKVVKPASGVQAASTPTTGANLFLPGLMAGLAAFFAGLLLIAGVRLRRRSTV